MTTSTALSTAAPLEIHSSARHPENNPIEVYVKTQALTFRLRIHHGTVQNSSLRAWLEDEHPGHVLEDWGLWSDVEGA